MGFEFDLETVYQEDDNFILPEYFKLDEENTWQAITESIVPASTNLITTEVPSSVSQITYLTPSPSSKILMAHGIILAQVQALFMQLWKTAQHLPTTGTVL